MKKHSLFVAISLAAVLSLSGCGGSPAAETGLSTLQAEETTESPQQTIETDESSENEGNGSEANAPAAESTAESMPADSSSGEPTASGSSTVYFTSDISAEGLVRIYEALGWTPSGKTAVKISTGEPPASNYLRPELIGDLVQ